MKDPYLLPFILPNVFEISRTLTPDEFSPVLLKLRPLFALKDPPQNMLSELDALFTVDLVKQVALLEHLTLFEEKTTPPAFRERKQVQSLSSRASANKKMSCRSYTTRSSVSTCRFRRRCSRRYRTCARFWTTGPYRMFCLLRSR